MPAARWMAGRSSPTGALFPTAMGKCHSALVRRARFRVYSSGLRVSVCLILNSAQPANTTPAPNPAAHSVDLRRHARVSPPGG